MKEHLAFAAIMFVGIVTLATVFSPMRVFGCVSLAATFYILFYSTLSMVANPSHTKDHEGKDIPITDLQRRMRFVAFAICGFIDAIFLVTYLVTAR